MSNTPFQEPPAQGASSGSVQTLASRPLQPVSDPSASRRVCFYKSGDLKFSGHRMVINARTFKTFDALLDALSKKVPLPFGVRTVTTPRGLHPVKGLEDLHDGGSYVCSDRKRVKPLNLNAVQRRQVPWNATRPVSAGRQGRRGPPRTEGIIRPAKITDRAAVRTPKRLVVIKNRDPTIKHTVVLQRRTAPTFDALLDYLSQIMHFPVLKLFSADGRRVDGLAGLILCSGVIVAAGNEPFKLGNYSFHRSGQNAPSVYSDVMEASRLQPLTYKKKSFSSGRGSRNFSLSSERYIVNQINKSLNGSTNNHQHHNNGSFETELNLNNTSTDTETCEHDRQEDRCPTCIIPQDEDIEKSFRVNQDGSMTVEMKVRLTIKEEEMLQWTTTLSRTSLNQRTGCASKSGSGKSSPDSNNAMAKDASGISEDESKEENHPTVSRERGRKSYSPRALEKPKTCFKRTPTPGPRRTKKTASVESITTVTESGFQESTLGQYSYVERTTDMTEGYCLVRHSNRPVPKPRKTASAGAGNKGSHSSVRSAGVAEVLQIENNGMEITETVMHIYERQGCYDNYFANNEYSTDELPGHGSSPIPQDKPASTGSGPHSSSNDCDIDFTQQSFTADSLHRRKEEILSLSSEPISPAPEISNNISAITSNTQTQSSHQEAESITKDNTVPHEKKKKVNKPAGKQKSSPSTTPDKNQKDSMANSSKTAKHASADKLSNVTGKRSGSSSESGKNGPKGKEGETLQTKKKVNRDDTAPSKKQALLLNSEHAKGTSSKKQVKVNPRAPRDNGHNVNTPETKTTRPPTKKNMLDILQPKQPSLPGKKGVTQQKSMSEKRISSPNQTLELNESVSMPTLNHTPSDVHQYVESWLQKISPDSVPYMEETATAESQPRTKVVFQIGGDSESEAKSECQADADGCYPSHGDAVAKSMSCLSVPVCGDGPSADVQNNVQKAKGLCASMPSVRIDPVDRESRLRTHKSAEAIGPVEDESSAFTSNLLSPKGRIKPVLQQLCSSIQCIRRASDPKSSNLEKSNSLPDFSSQVASVFGSSSKAFLSFLSVMTLRETLTGSVAEDSYDSRNTSEAMLMMESLQKISTIEDEEEQRASLTDLQSRTSSQLIERWRDFQVLRERLESEPLSPKFSEQEFALDVVSEGDAFDDQHLGIDELMEELNMPQDLRQEIASTLQQTKSFYPEVEESTYVEKEMHHSDSEEELEQFVKETKQSPEPDPNGIAENVDKTSVTEDTDNGYKLAGEMDDSRYREEEEGEGEGKMEDGEEEKYVGKVEEHRVEETQEEDEDTKEVEEMGEETEARAEEWEEEAEEERKKGGEVEDGEEEPEEEEEEGTGEAMLVDEEDEEMEWKEEVVEENDEDEEGDEEVVDRKSEREEVEEESIEESEEEGEEEIFEKNERERVEEVIEEKDEEDEGEENVNEDEEDEGEENVNEDEEDEDEGEENVIEEDEKEEVEENVIEEDEKEGVEENVNDEEDEEVENVNDNEDEEVGEEAIEEKVEEDEAELEEVVKEEEDKEEEQEKGESEGERVEEDGEIEEREEEEDEVAEDQMTEEKLECEDDKGHGTDTANEFKTDDGEEEYEDRSSSLPHPVAISQQLLDFVNSALQSSSLTFTYDARGNIRIGPDNAQVVQTNQIIIPKSREDSLYGLKRLPSPNTSDLSDYRPETSESGGYKTQESVDITSESGEEPSARQSPDRSRTKHMSDLPNGIIIGQQVNSNLPFRSKSEHLQSPILKSGGSLSSYDSGTKALREDLSYFSAASSLKADAELAAERSQCISSPSEVDSNDGVLIEQGRWLLKENHLIRKSPPIPVGMYGNVDTTSVDTCQENTSLDSLPYYLNQRNPLAVISSSELEEMAKPQTPKCTYYNMSHGSDSDPFLDDVSVKSGKTDASSSKRKGLRVSPTTDTSKTRPKKNGSLSSFASVEFKMPDSKVHPEGEPSAVTQARRPPGVAGRVLRAQDSLDTLHVRCGQYCPIL
ncbi:uncharacterized protein ACJ7VT_017516 [Polymixia lowei]